jgi:hypothetical protein
MNKLAGLQVTLDRLIDHKRPCCANVCTITATRELTCAACGKHRGWLSGKAAQRIERIAACFGAPTTPLVLRNFVNAPTPEMRRGSGDASRSPSGAGAETLSPARTENE